MNRNIARRAKIALARKDLFFYCQLMAPDFYKDDREYLIELCRELQDFAESDYDVLIINIGPRHGKSRTAQLFTEWSYGKRKTSLKIMTGSYNETVATQFSKGVRDTISEEKADKDKVVYSDIFSDIRIKHGDGAANLWSLEGGHANYLATSPTGTATGFGADYLIIDDLIKNAKEAHNARVLDDHWQWFTNTMLSRLESGGKIIIIMTRWHSKDLAGRAMKELPKLGYKVRQVKMKTVQDDGSMLCDEVLSKAEYDRKVKTMGRDIALANYQQETIDLKGRLYTKFKTYSAIPKDFYGQNKFRTIKAYCDTADTGNDYLCNIIYGVFNGEAYILDVYYTKDPMEITEKEVAKRLYEFKVRQWDVEGNNGGRGFSRSVGKILKEEYDWTGTSILPFHQTENKDARIYSNSTWVMEHIYYPENWKDKWSEFYDSMFEYQREGKNENDDAQDTITGVADKMISGGEIQFG